MIDTERFLQARQEALGRVGGAGGIGTLSEKALHAALKSYYEPDFESREVKVGGFVADIVGESSKFKRAGLTGWAANSTCFWKRRA